MDKCHYYPWKQAVVAVFTVITWTVRCCWKTFSLLAFKYPPPLTVYKHQWLVCLGYDDTSPWDAPPHPTPPPPPFWTFAPHHAITSWKSPPPPPFRSFITCYFCSHHLLQWLVKPLGLPEASGL